jgi:hypothetical protein
MQGMATNANVAIHDQRLLNLLFIGAFGEALRPARVRERSTAGSLP